MKPIKILPLGASGSGKTVYLASLFEKLALKHPDTCFSLHTDAQSGKELAIQYNKIKNLTTGWPAGTKGYQWKNFKFDCIVASKHGDHKIMALEYLEFPGGVLTDPSNLTEEQQKRLDESDVFLILIDGVQIFRLLEKVSSDSSFEDEMKILLNPIGCQLGKPLHFVVTKWDIVEKKYTLDDVVKFLNGIDCFASVMEQRRNLDLDTRLIPVSAVGKGFAQLLDDGQMVKLPNAKAKPYNVDMPISCILFDVLTHAKNKIEIERNKSFLKRLWFFTTGSRSMFLSLGKIAIEHVPVPLGGVIVKKILSLGIDGLQTWINKSPEELRHEYGGEVLNSQNATQAFEVIIKHQAHELHWLRKEFPASVLHAKK